MTDPTAETQATRPTLHIISHLNWEREGNLTVEAAQGQLLELVADLVDVLARQGTLTLLDGQTIVLDDLAGVHPSLLHDLKTHAAHLYVGPFYVRPDTMLVDGESLVRNLLMGREDTKRLGLPPLSVAYLPDSCQQPAQMPQILLGFGLDAVFLCVSRPVMPLPFRWQAPNGAAVLAANYLHRQVPLDAVTVQRYGQPDGPFLWVRRFSQDDIDKVPGVVNEVASLQAYMAALRETLPDELRPTLKGEVRLQQHPLDAGRYSARTRLKQQHAHTYAQLNYITERWLALAAVHGSLKHPANVRALLRRAWRLLLQNQTQATLGGLSADEVADEVMMRYRKLADVIGYLQETALEALPGVVSSGVLTPPEGEMPIVVWNPHNQRVQQVVQVTLQLPENQHPATLTNPQDESQPFYWDAETGVLMLYAEVPPLGYAVYTLALSEAETPAHYTKQLAAGRIIGSASAESQTLSVNQGRVHWNRGAHQIQNVLSYHDGGDIGDLQNYHEPEKDMVVQAGLTDIVQTETTALYERLIFRHRMRIAPRMNGDERRRGLRVLDLSTQATFYDKTPGIYFKTTFENAAEDHRLRVHLRTGMRVKQVRAYAPFDATQRPAAHELQSMVGGCLLIGEGETLALLTKGLAEFELIEEEEGETTVALTLLRAVGWLNQNDNQAAPHAQSQTNFTAHYALVPLPNDPVAFIHALQQYHAALYARQYDERPPANEHTYLVITDSRAILSALKPPEEGAGLIVRLYNPTDELITTHIAPHGTLKDAQRTNLAETSAETLEIHDNQVRVALKPHEIVTLRLTFDLD